MGTKGENLVFCRHALQLKALRDYQWSCAKQAHTPKYTYFTKSLIQG